MTITFLEASDRLFRASEEYRTVSEAYGYVRQILAKARRYTHVKHKWCLAKYPGFDYLLKLEDRLETELVGLEIRLRGSQILFEHALKSGGLTQTNSAKEGQQYE